MQTLLLQGMSVEADPSDLNKAILRNLRQQTFAFTYLENAYPGRPLIIARISLAASKLSRISRICVLVMRHGLSNSVLAIRLTLYERCMCLELSSP